MHSKLMIVDDKITIVGSGDLHLRVINLLSVVV